MDTKMRRDWILSEISRNQAYHNHKENMSWAATAFYVSGIVTVGLFGQNIRDCLWRSALTVIIFLAGYLAFRFINMQFRNRWIAAGRVEGLIRAIMDLSKNKETKDNNWVREEGKFYPNYVEERIPDRRRFAESRYDTEVVSYIAVIVATVVSLFLLWLGRTT